MKKHQNPYHFLDTFCFRAPLFSLNFHQNLVSKSNFDINELKKLWENDTIKEAIYLASVELYFEIDKLVTNKNSAKFNNIKQPLLKYLIRASTRCTPFGLFSGVGTGTIGKTDVVLLNDLSQYNRKTTFDTNYLFNLSTSLSKIDVIQNQLKFHPNTSLYHVVKH